MPNEPERSPADRVEAVAGEDAVILEVGGEEFERFPVDPEHVAAVTRVMQTILGDNAYLVRDECDPRD